MPLSAKGNKIMNAMRKEYGEKEGKAIFYASKNKGKIAGVDRADDNQHMGFTKGESKSVEKFVSECDALTKRMDAFEERQHQRKPIKLKPKNKDNLQPSNPHPKEVC